MSPDEIMEWVRREVERAPRTAQPSSRGFPQVAAVAADATLPEDVRAACARYRGWLFELGAAWPLRWSVQGRDLFGVYAATDGDEAWLEIFDDRGAAVGGAIFGHEPTRWVTCGEVRADAQRQTGDSE